MLSGSTSGKPSAVDEGAIVTTETPEAERRPLRAFRVTAIATGVALVVLIAGILSRRTEHRLDLDSGRVQRADFVFGFEVSSQAIETPFTRFAPPAAPPTSGTWRVYSSKWAAKWLWGFDNRGSHIAGSAAADLKAFALLCEQHGISDEEGKVPAVQLLPLLRAGDADGISEHVEKLREHLASGVGEIPAPSDEGSCSK